jgi:hypothetical protein
MDAWRCGGCFGGKQLLLAAGLMLPLLVVGVHLLLEPAAWGAGKAVCKEKSISEVLWLSVLPNTLIAVSRYFNSLLVVSFLRF